MSLPRPVRLQGSALARRILRLAGWRLVFDGLPGLQGVLVVYPHTSNWDFVVGVLAKWAIGIKVTFWGKDSLFRLPLLGRWLRWLGGLPVDRTSAGGIVGPMARELQTAREQGRFMWLALSPEGTRSVTPAWRSGFYHVARAAGVPVGLVFLDYGKQEVGVEHFMLLSGDIDADMAQIAHHLGARKGRRPDLATPIRLKP